MDSSMIKGIVIGGIAMVVVAAGAVPTYKALTKPKVADVIAVQEVTETVVTPREECQNVQVTKQAPTEDPNRVTGTVIGGVAGGLLGSSIGSGRGRTAATIAGAAGGAYVGNQVQKNAQQRNVITTTQRRCKTVNDTTQNLVGYDVTYRLGDKEGTVRTSFKPGATLPVKDGEVVAAPPAASRAERSVDFPAAPVSRPRPGAVRSRNRQRNAVGVADYRDCESSDAGLALPVDQDGSARRARGLHMMLVPAEVVRDIPVIQPYGRGHALAALHILRINGARYVRSHHCAGGCADARRPILPAATTDLMAEDTADDASHHGARDIDTGRAGVHNLTLDPAALLWWSHHGTHRGHRRLVQRLVRSAPVVITGGHYNVGSRKTLRLIGLTLRFRRL
jgi:uncharacterized protein YcfJ